MIHRLLNSLILLPDPYGYQAPSELGLHAEEVSFPNAQGVPLRGLFCQCATQDNPALLDHDETPVILFCPGTSGNLSSHLHYVELLCRAGFAVLGFDYTGFGQSAGRAALHNLVPDVLCACDFLQQQKGIERFGIFGLSISANVALLAAAVRPRHIRAVAVEGVALQQEVVRGILAEGIMGPRHMRTIIYDGMLQPARESHVLNPYPVSAWLANGLARLGVTIFPSQVQDPRLPTRTLEDVPVFFIHGVEDPLLPCEATLQVYTAKPGDKRLWLIPDVGHAQEPVLARDAEYSAQLGDFFHHALRRGRRFDTPKPPFADDIRVHPSTAHRLRVYNPGAPGLVSVTFVGDQTLELTTVWVEERIDVPCPVGASLVLATGLRLFEVEGRGDTAQIRHTTRGLQYQETFRSHIRELGKLLHEGRLKELEAPLRALPRERPEAPFDFFLGLYCVQIMRRTKRKQPSIARAAAEIFIRYRPDETPGEWNGPSHLWGLVASILGKPGGPRLVTPTRQ